MKRVLIHSVYFHPDDCGIPRYSTDIARFFRDEGHAVTVVTGFPFYPRWQKRDEDQGCWFRKEGFEGIRVFRNYIYVPKKVKSFGRMLHDISFCLSSVVGFVRAGRQDLVVMESPPILAGLVAMFFSWMWGARYSVHVQDLQLDAAVELAMVRPGIATRVLGLVERVQLKAASSVIAITDGMKDRIVQKGVDPNRVHSIFNWIIPQRSNGDSFEPAAGNWFDDNFPENRGKLSVVYSGNLGVKQGLDALLEIAGALAGDGRFRFYVFGEGADQKRLEQRAKDMELSNLSFCPFLSRSGYQKMIRSCDVSFISQMEKVGDLFFPSKLLDILQAEKPVLVSAGEKSELANFVRKHGIGRVRSGGDITGLANDLREIALASKEELERMHDSVASARQCFAREDLIQKFADISFGLVHPSGKLAPLDFSKKVAGESILRNG